MVMAVTRLNARTQQCRWRSGDGLAVGGMVHVCVAEFVRIQCGDRACGATLTSSVAAREPGIRRGGVQPRLQSLRCTAPGRPAAACLSRSFVALLTAQGEPRRAARGGITIVVEHVVETG
jgi:hypothetical protein